MATLKSKTGCLTCVTRKKKCDEALPRCGNCKRLQLRCVTRQGNAQGAITSVTSTALRQRPPLRVAISNGYPGFQSNLEKQLAAESPTVLCNLVSCMADPGYQHVSLFGRFCTQNPIVRQAVVAFSAFTKSENIDAYKLMLKIYQECIATLKDTRAYEKEDAAEKDCVLTAIMFLGLLEGLKTGDSSNSMTHFEMCRRILVSRLSQSTAIDPGLLKIYRMVAEIIMCNFATLTPFNMRFGIETQDWGTSFDCLFPGNDTSLSPFLGGVHQAYRTMFRAHMLLREMRHAPIESLASHPPVASFDSLWQHLDELEDDVPAYADYAENPDAIQLYQAKYKLLTLALRVYLFKIWRPDAVNSDSYIQCCLREAVDILGIQDIREKGSPIMRWPLTILICATHASEDFELMRSRMQQVASVVDPAVRRKMLSTCRVLTRYRLNALDPPQRSCNGLWWPANQLDYLLEPHHLERLQETP